MTSQREHIAVQAWFVSRDFMQLLVFSGPFSLQRHSSEFLPYRQTYWYLSFPSCVVASFTSVCKQC